MTKPETVPGNSGSGTFGQELLEPTDVHCDIESDSYPDGDCQDGAPICWLILTPTGQIQQINRTGAELLSLRRTDLLGTDLKRYIARPDQPKYRQHLSRCLREQVRQRTELRLIRQAHGSPVWVELITQCIGRPGSGPSRRLHGVLVDITERKLVEKQLRDARELLERRLDQRTLESAAINANLQAEIEQHRQSALALRESEERFRLMVDGIEDYAIFRLNAKGQVDSWNRGAQRIIGYREPDIVGRHFSRFYPPEDVQVGKPERLLRVARESGSVREEGWRVRSDGSRFWASALITAISGPDGELQGFAKVTRDVTERRQALQALQRSERSLNDFFNQSPLAFLWIEPGGRIRRINVAGQTLLGCSRSVCEKSRLERYFVDRDHARRLLRRLAGGGELHQARARIRRRDGTVRHVLVDANGTWVDGRMAYSRWFVRDITRRVQLEQEVLAIAEQEQRRIGEDLHDDLCQQLAGIQFLSQSLANQLRATSEADAQRADNIAQMIRQSIDRTRELARGLSPMQFEGGLPGALQALAQMTEKLFGVSCRFSCSKPVEGVNESTTMHLYRIAQEAVSNAIKHGKSSCVRISLRPQTGRLVLTVRDDGDGMPEESCKQKGMGLRVMEYRAGVIGGTLSVRSNARSGTVVRCVVPSKTLNASGKRMYENHRR